MKGEAGRLGQFRTQHREKTTTTTTPLLRRVRSTLFGAVGSLIGPEARTLNMSRVYLEIMKHSVSLMETVFNLKTEIPIGIS